MKSKLIICTVVGCLVFAVISVQAQTTIFSESFEGAWPGAWVVGNNNSNTVAKWGDNSAKDYTGNWSGFCADNGSNSRTTYDNDLNTYMQRQNISLSGYSSVTLTFKYWMNTEPSFDNFQVNVRNQLGNWHNLMTISGNSSGWKTRTINLSSYAGQTGLIISFDFVSDGSVVPPGAAGVWVDDVLLTATQTADLALTNLSVSPSTVSTRSFTACSFNIVNNGPSALSSEPVMVEYYLSTDQTFGDADDIGIGNTGFTLSIAAYNTQTIILSSTGLGNMVRDWPSGTDCGNYYVFARVRLTNPPPSDPISSNNYDRTNSTINYNNPSVCPSEPDIDVQPTSLTIIEQGCQRTSAIVGDGSSISRSSPLEFYSPLSSGKGAYLHFNKQVFEGLKNSSNVTLTDFVLEEGRLIDLELQQFTIFDDRTIFVEGTLAGDITLPVPDVTLFRGIVKGYPGSNVYLGLSDLAVNGFIELDGQKFILSGDRKSGKKISEQVLTIFDYESVSFANVEPWLCGGGVEVARNGQIPLEKKSPEERSTLVPKICYVAVDGDYEYYQTMGSSSSAALDYIVELLGATTLFYQRDFDATLWLSYARVWSTSSDPYAETGADDPELEEFRDYWNANMGHVTRNIAHKFASTFNAGIAYVDVLCNQNIAYGISHVNGSFPYPIESGPDNWDLYVVSHEIGHNFGTHHTHCYDPPIDQCWGSDEGCYSGSINCSRGTIMSYCHLCGLGTSNIDLNFHSRVIDHVVPIVQSASCLDAASPSFTVHNVGTEMLEVYNISSFDGWLSALPIAFSVEAGGSRQVDVLIDWSQLSTTIQGNLNIQSNDPDENPVNVNVTAVSCSLSFICGDINDDGTPSDVLDLTYLVDWIFRGGPEPPILTSADLNGDGSPGTILDLTYIVDDIFRGGPAPTCGQ